MAIRHYLKIFGDTKAGLSKSVVLRGCLGVPNNGRLEVLDHTTPLSIKTRLMKECHA